jgi:integrase
MASIEKRGPYQYRVKIRRKGVSETRTFDSLKDAEDWARIMEGKVTGDEYQDRKKARDTSLSQACEWFEANLDRSKADAKNKLSKLAYWRASEFANWSVVSIRPADLIRWRRSVLDEDNAEDGDVCGPDAECGPQTVVHRLNVLSQVLQRWALAHDQQLTNPVVPGVRPSLPRGRDRRLMDGEEKRLLKAAEASSRTWLRAAIIIAIETCMRQSELAELTWDRVKLDAEFPHANLVKTKNGKPRKVPLSQLAVEAFRSLYPAGVSGVIGTKSVFPVETGRGIAHAFRDAISEEQFPDLRWHDLRHEGTSRLFELTDLRDTEIMAITGHLRPEMLARYTHLRSDRLAARLPGRKASAPGQAGGEVR